MSTERVAVFTAAGSGMGADAARYMANQGYNIAVLSSSGKGEALADEFGGVGVTGSNQSGEDLQKLIDGAMEKWGRVDVLVNSAGHGPKGETWKIARDLHPLLNTCAELTDGQRAFVLLTCHTPGFDPPEVEAILADAVFGTCQAGATAQPLSIRCEDGRTLPAGVVARWPR